MLGRDRTTNIEYMIPVRLAVDADEMTVDFYLDKDRVITKL
jgi:hypothetical protein